MNSESKWVPAYVSTTLMWGLSFYFIMVGLQSLTPNQVAAGRVTIGALTLWLLILVLKLKMPKPAKYFGHFFVMGLLNNSLPGLFFAYAETSVSSIVASIMNATVPLLGLLATVFIFREARPKFNQQIGLLIGLAGVAVVLGIWQGTGANDPTGILYCLAAVSLYGISFPYMRRFIIPIGLHPILGAALQLTFGTIQVLPFALFEWAPIAPTSSSLMAVIALGAFGSGLAFATHFYVVEKKGPLIASTVTYWMPLVAVVAGAFLLQEELHWYEPVGGLIVLLGILIVQDRISLSKK
jgi:drug/metabolite transporter (DMT)-like permease